MASVCRSLQCLLSTLTQVGGDGLLFRLVCSVVLCGGRGTADKCHWRVWGALTVFQPHWVCPHSQHVCFLHLHCSGSRLLSRERALRCVDFPGLSRSHSGFRVLHKSTDSVGPAFCASPGWSSSGSQELDKRTLPGCRAPSPLRGPGPRCALCLFRGAGL